MNWLATRLYGLLYGRESFCVNIYLWLLISNLFYVHQANGGNTASSGLGNIFDNLVNHMTPAQCDFLKHWDRLIDLEAQTTLVCKFF
jgi:DNA replication ATP-dependent helicase Dna2